MGIIKWRAVPGGCLYGGPGRKPPMVLISGNIMLMARATQIVLSCSPPSGAMPAASG